MIYQLHHLLSPPHSPKQPPTNCNSTLDPKSKIVPLLFPFFSHHPPLSPPSIIPYRPLTTPHGLNLFHTPPRPKHSTSTPLNPLIWPPALTDSHTSQFHKKIVRERKKRVKSNNWVLEIESRRESWGNHHHTLVLTSSSSFGGLSTHKPPLIETNANRRAPSTPFLPKLNFSPISRYKPFAH